MDAITVTVEFEVLEHGWVKANVLGLAVERTGRDRADAESSIINALREHFAEASRNADDLSDRRALSLAPSWPPWESTATA